MSLRLANLRLRSYGVLYCNGGLIDEHMPNLPSLHGKNTATSPSRDGGQSMWVLVDEQLWGRPELADRTN